MRNIKTKLACIRQKNRFKRLRKHYKRSDVQYLQSAIKIVRAEIRKNVIFRNREPLETLQIPRYPFCDNPRCPNHFVGWETLEEVSHSMLIRIQHRNLQWDVVEITRSAFASVDGNKIFLCETCVGVIERLRETGNAQ